LRFSSIPVNFNPMIRNADRLLIDAWDMLSHQRVVRAIPLENE
jgi:hypothetical protein